MKKDIHFRNYVFTGLLYLPNQSPLEINGEFSVDWSSLEGKMSYPSELRNTIQGNLINAQEYNVPNSKENPRNFLLFAHFSKELTNHHYFLVKNGNEFIGKYIGKADFEEGKVRGVDTTRYSMNIEHADYILKDEKTHKVELELFNK